MNGKGCGLPRRSRGRARIAGAGQPGARPAPAIKSIRAEPVPYIRLCEVLRAGVDGKEIVSAVPPPTFRDGLSCMEVLDAIRASAAADGARITLGD